MRTFPWNEEQYIHDLVKNGSLTWRERDTQIYLNFMQLLIGKQLTSDEAEEIRKSNISDFNQNPQFIKNDVGQTEATLQQVYSANSPDAIAYFREQLFASFYQAAQQNPQLNDSPLMKIYNRHVQILQYDPVSQLSLSNQDVSAYIKYLQFQSMLMGQSNTVSSQELEAMQVQLVNSFNGLPIQQKQSLAYASFIWDAVEKQWSNLSSEQQQQYIGQVQSQMNLQNASVSPQQVEESIQTQDDISEDIQALVEKSKAEAEAKGMTVEEYIRYKQRELNANSNLFTMMQNTMTENHATMLNVINGLGGSDDYYYVDYN